MPRRCRGFTLLELMIVLVLIGVLMGMVSFATGSSPARQARQEAVAFAGLAGAFLVYRRGLATAERLQKLGIQAFQIVPTLADSFSPALTTATQAEILPNWTYAGTSPKDQAARPVSTEPTVFCAPASSTPDTAATSRVNRSSAAS